MRNQSFVIEAEAEEGIAAARAWAEKELGMSMSNTECLTNPDVVILRHGLFSVADARRVCEVAASAPFGGEHKVVAITASRAYHEAQNALLKLFEEPSVGTYLFLVMPSLGGLLPTLRSRVQILTYQAQAPSTKSETSAKHEKTLAEEFLKANKEKRSTIIKKLASGRDDEEKRAFREEAIAILNGVEAAMCEGQTFTKHAAVLSDIAILREHLYDRSAPIRMILEHLSIIVPENLSRPRQV